MRIETLRQMIEVRLAVVAMDATLRAAAAALSKPHIGLLVVCDENRMAAGVVCRSNIVRHLMSAGVAEASVATLMSRGVISCSTDDDLHATWQKMSARKLQNMPVLGEDSRPVGVLDIRDVLKVLFEQEEYQGRLLSNYVAGVGYQ